MSDKGPLSPHIAAILERERDDQDLSQKALGAMAGISQSQVSKYLRAERVLNIDRLDALCTALGLNIVTVISEADANR